MGQWELLKLRDRKKKKSEEGLGDKWDTIETNICIMVIPEREERVFWRNNGWKLVRFEDMNIYIQEAQRTPSKMNSDTETYYNQTFKRDKDKLESSKKDEFSHATDPQQD